LDWLPCQLASGFVLFCHWYIGVSILPDSLQNSFSSRHHMLAVAIDKATAQQITEFENDGVLF
jgi:hypothetical protein